MKKAVLTLFALLFLATAAFAQKPCKLTVKWSFEGVVDGYDHDNKMVLFLDGKEFGESTVKKETQPNSHTFEVPAGEHEVKLVNYAMYEGDWEEHTVANEYSLDCMFEERMSLKKKCTIELTFDIQAEETRSAVKKK